MAGRPGTLPWDMSTFTGSEPITRWSDNYSFLNNQINDSGAGFTNYAADTGTANNLIVTLPSAPVAYEAGMMVCVLVANNNTGASVINVNALGNVSILNPGGNALIGGELFAGVLVTLVYNGSAFLMLGPCARRIITTTAATTLTLDCHGCSSVAIHVVFTGGSMQIIPSHLAQGVPITAVYVNTSGASATISMVPTDPAGSVYGIVNAIQSGTANGTAIVDFIHTGIGLNNAASMMFTGASHTDGQLDLSH